MNLSLKQRTYRGFIGFVAVFTFCSSMAQELGILTHPDNGAAFLSEEIPSVHITCGDAIEWMFEEENWYADVEHPATFIFTSLAGSDTLANVGFRLRGNTSRAAPKKSFKISFDTFESDQEWNGLDKLNLNGEHNDPSVIRSRLSWECLRDAGVPVSRVQHVNLYINGTFYGVYANIEHIDGEWLEKRFDHAHGNLWKCTYPADLNFISNNADAYKFTPSWSDQRVYDLKTNNLNDDYSALAAFIDALNNTALDELPCSLERIFDVDAYLKIAAGEILSGHWDNYIGNRNNFYLYQRSTDHRLMYIPYDMDNTMGIQWFGEWTTQDIYAWTTGNDRPLYSRLLQVPQYRDRFTWYIRWWMENYYTEDWIDQRGDWLISLLEPHIENDTFYSSSYSFGLQDFMESMDEPWGSHVAHSLNGYAASRLFWADIQADEITAAPPPVQCWAEGPRLNDSIQVKCWVPENEDLTSWAFELELDIDGSTSEHPLDLIGINEHGHEWGTSVPLNNGSDVHWMVSFTNPEGALNTSPCEPQRIWNTGSPIPLLINEVMPVNNSVIADASGHYGDWVELLNHGSVPMNVGNYYITNRLMEPARWPLPSVTLEPGQHLLIWCDDEPVNGPLHSSFTLNGGGDEVFIMHQEDGAWRVIDDAEWSNAPENASWGRSTDGADDWIWFHDNLGNSPTPNGPNGVATSIDSSAKDELWDSWNPINPCNHPCQIKFPMATDWSLMSGSGQLLLTGFGDQSLLNLPSSTYHLLLYPDGNPIARKLIIQ